MELESLFDSNLTDEYVIVWNQSQILELRNITEEAVFQLELYLKFDCYSPKYFDESSIKKSIVVCYCGVNNIKNLTPITQIEIWSCKFNSQLQTEEVKQLLTTNYSQAVNYIKQLGNCLFNGSSS